MQGKARVYLCCHPDDLENCLEVLDKIFPEIMNRIKPGYGDVQILNRASEDATEIPYAEKPKKQLENILVGDELADMYQTGDESVV